MSILILWFSLDYKKLYKKEFKVDINTHPDKNDVDRKPIISENGEGKYKVQINNYSIKWLRFFN